MAQASKNSKLASKVLLLVLLSTLFAQTISVRVSSKSQNLSIVNLPTLDPSDVLSMVTFSSSTTKVPLSTTPTTWFSCSSNIQDTNWIYSPGYNTITCAGNTYVGPYGTGAKIKSPTFSIGNHLGIIVSLKVAYIDSWDGEAFKVIADDTQEVFSKSYNVSSSKTNTCQNSWNDNYESITFGFNHTYSSLKLVITSGLDQASSDEAWGVCDLAVSYSIYPVDSSGAPIIALTNDIANTWFACSSPPNEEGWKYSARYTTITCNGNTYIGPYGSGATLTSPRFTLGSHKGIIVSLKVAYIDSWDGEAFKVIADDTQEVFSKSYNVSSSKTNTCQNSWNDNYESITFGFNHTSSSLTFVISSGLNQPSTDEAWGICNFAITPSSYQVTSSGDEITQKLTQATTFFACSGHSSEKYWSYSTKYSKITCLGSKYLGPYGAGASITSPTFKLGRHKGVIVSFKLALIDSWDGEAFKITADDTLIYSKTHNHLSLTSLEYPNTCQNSWNDFYDDVTIGFNHTAETLTLTITSTLNQASSDEAWGICNLAITPTAYAVTSNGKPIGVSITQTTTTWFSCSSNTQDTNWSYSAGYSTITCAGNTYLGPYGTGATLTSPSLILPSHKGIKVTFNLAWIDSWDGEALKITADGVLVFSKTHIVSQGTSNTCHKSWNDAYESITFGFNHTSSSLVLAITSGLDQPSSDEAWGICNFAITTTSTPLASSGTPIFALTSTTNKWFSCSSPTKDSYWTYSAGYSSISCAGTGYKYLGPYGTGATLTSPSLILPSHKGIKVTFNLAWIDSWDGEALKITADGVLVFSKTHIVSQGTSNTCHKGWNDVYESITFGFNHTSSSLVLAITSELDQPSNDEAWGICDFTVTTSSNPVTSSGTVITTTASTSTSTSATTSVSGIFPSAMDLGCISLPSIASQLTDAVTLAAGASEKTKTIIDTTVSTIVNGLLNNPITGEVAGSNACLGNFLGSEIIEEIDQCSAMLLPETSEYSVIAFNVPVPGGFCSAQPEITMAAFCLAIGKSSNNLPSVSIQANSGALSCLATAAGSGVGYVIASAIEAGLDTVSLGLSLTSSFEKTTKIYTGSIEEVQISGNYYDYISLEVDPTQFGIPSVFEISGSATRVVKVMDNAGTWISKLGSAKGVKDVAKTLFGDLSMLVAIELELTMALADKTLGLLPDLGPYTLGIGTLYATTSTSPLASGQSLKPGVYTYVAANNILPELIADIMTNIVSKVTGILDTILGDFGISTTSLVERLTPKSSGSSNALGFMVNTEEISLLVQTFLGPIDIIAPGGTTMSVECSFKYSGNKFSCRLKLGSITKFFTGLLDGAMWVIKEAEEFFDETGDAIVFAAKELKSFTNTAIKETAKGIKKGYYTVSKYATKAAKWAEKAVYQCGVKTVQSAFLCGTTTFTSAAKCGVGMFADAVGCGEEWVTCGWSTVTDGAKCGYSYIKCGTEIVKDGAKCGWDTIKDGAICGWNCFTGIFSGSFACSCSVPKSCSIDVTCKVDNTCEFEEMCSKAKSCELPKTCEIANTCEIAADC